MLRRNRKQKLYPELLATLFFIIRLFLGGPLVLTASVQLKTLWSLTIVNVFWVHEKFVLKTIYIVIVHRSTRETNFYILVTVGEI